MAAAGCGSSSRTAPISTSPASGPPSAASPSRSSPRSSGSRWCARSGSRTATAAACSACTRTVRSPTSSAAGVPSPPSPRRLLPGKLRRTPGVVGGDPFRGILALEEPLLQLPLEGETLLEPDLEPARHRALDEADGLRCLGGRDELPRVLERGSAEPLGVRVDDLVHEAVGLRFLHRERRAF